MLKKKTDFNKRREEKTIVFITYVDALYTYKKTKKVPNPIHHVLGRIFVSNKHCIGISFCDEASMPTDGLLIPRGAQLKTPVKKRVEKILSSVESGTVVSIEWVDIVRFRNGQVPGTLSTVYTEGILSRVADGFIVIDDPETIIFSEGQKPRNHPKKRAKQYYIPLTLVHNVTQYAKN